MIAAYVLDELQQLQARRIKHVVPRPVERERLKQRPQQILPNHVPRVELILGADDDAEEAQRH